MCIRHSNSSGRLWFELKVQVIVCKYLLIFIFKCILKCIFEIKYLLEQLLFEIVCIYKDSFTILLAHSSGCMTPSSAKRPIYLICVTQININEKDYLWNNPYVVITCSQLCKDFQLVGASGKMLKKCTLGNKFIGILLPEKFFSTSLFRQ